MQIRLAQSATPRSWKPKAAKRKSWTAKQERDEAIPEMEKEAIAVAKQRVMEQRRRESETLVVCEKGMDLLGASKTHAE